MGGRILVINPNSNEEVTRSMDRALAPLRAAMGAEIACITLADGPFGIESWRDMEAAAPLVCRAVEARAGEADAFIVACYSDPGLRAAREAVDKPVLGMAESALGLGAALGGRLGVIATAPASIERHVAYARTLGLESLVAGEVPLGLRVEDLADEATVGRKMVAAGRRLQDEFSAKVIVMGCAGMARYRVMLQESLGCPVIDPVQAAVAAAVCALNLGLSGFKTAVPLRSSV